MTHHVLHVDREHRLPVLVDLASAPGPHPGLHPHQARRQGAGPPAQQERRPDRRAARQPRPGRPHPQPRRLPLRQGRRAGGHRHRGPRHPRRRRRARRARRPAGRAQGLPAPLRPYGARRQRRHRRHPDDHRAGARRPRPDPGGRHQADHDSDPGLHPPGPARARSRRAQADRGPGDSCRVVAPDTLWWRRRRRRRRRAATDADAPAGAASGTARRLGAPAGRSRPVVGVRVTDSNRTAPRAATTAPPPSAPAAADASPLQLVPKHPRGPGHGAHLALGAGARQVLHAAVGGDGELFGRGVVERAAYPVGNGVH